MSKKFHKHDLKSISFTPNSALISNYYASNVKYSLNVHVNKAALLFYPSGTHYEPNLHKFDLIYS